jgi:hypothetical protein
MPERSRLEVLESEGPPVQPHAREQVQSQEKKMSNITNDIHTVAVKSSHALQLLRKNAELKANVLPGVEAVGAAYNPFLLYASADSITVQIFDWNKAGTKPVIFEPNYVIPTPVEAQNQGTSTYTTTSGVSVNTFQRNLSNTFNIGGRYNFFSGSLSSEYSFQSLERSVNEFTRIQQSVTLWSLHLLVSAELRKYLRDDFLSELDSLPLTEAAAQRFFDTYGSHFLTGVVMGGSAVLSSATNRTTVDRSFSIELVAQVFYKALTGQLSAEEEIKYRQAIESFKRSSDSNSRVIGGDSVKAASAFNGRKSFDAWTASIRASPNFVNFVTANPVAGIWRLCKNTEQANYLMNYYDKTWAPTQSAMRQRHFNYVDEIIVITGTNSTIEPPMGYTKIPYDLNSNAEGDYIYLCFHEEMFRPESNKPCITDIKIIYNNDPVPRGYEKLPQDLNKGAGGELVYLCYRKEPYNNEAAIKSLMVIGGSTSDVPPPYSFTKVPGDLNKGAGGEYVHICYSKSL